MTDADLLAEVRRILREVQELRGVVEKRLPTVLTKQRAAQELSISLSKLKGLIRSGELMVCEVGRTSMVPASEVQRLAASARREAAAARPARPRKPKHSTSPAEEAAKARRALKKKR